MPLDPTRPEQLACWRTREVPAPAELRPGLWVLPTPVPTPIGYTLCYVQADVSGLLVIDPGWPDEPAWAALTNGLARLGAAAGDVTTVVVTHLHPDHVGLAPRILDAAPGATLRMHAADLDRLLPGGQRRRASTDARWSTLMQTIGAPERLDVGTRRVMTPPLAPEQAERSVPVGDGDVVEHGDARWEVIWTPGHTRGSLVLHERRHGVVLTGDHVLPTVTPTVTQQDDADHDVLGDFLRSLGRMRELGNEDPDLEVLPGHQYAFRGLSHRADEMCAHHADRLQELREAVAAEPGATCFDLAHHLPWSRAGFTDLAPRDQAMAARETLVHLTHLRLAGEVQTAPGRHHRSDDPALRTALAVADAATRWYDV